MNPTFGVFTSLMHTLLTGGGINLFSPLNLSFVVMLQKIAPSTHSLPGATAKIKNKKYLFGKGGKFPF